MEQKKTLWIIAATGVFLLVVIGAAMMLYSPSNYSTPVIASVKPMQPSSAPTGGWTTPAPTNQPPLPPENKLQQEPQKVDELTVISNNTNVYDINTDNTVTTTPIDLNTLKEIATAENTSSITITQTPADKPATTPAPVVKAPAVTKPATTAVKTPAPVAKATPAPAPAPQHQYWVQAASFTAKKTADNARQILAENKIPAEVFTYTDSKKQVYFRVRVGPYTTKSEAEYWKSKIIQINEFKDTQSYITDTSAVSK